MEEIRRQIEENNRRRQEHNRQTEEYTRQLEENNRRRQEYNRQIEVFMSQLEENNFMEEFDRIINNRNNNHNNYNNFIETKINVNKLKEENKSCVICYEDFKDNDDAIFLPSFHVFHAKCIKEWLKIKIFVLYVKSMLKAI